MLYIYKTSWSATLFKSDNGQKKSSLDNLKKVNKITEEVYLKLISLFVDCALFNPIFYFFNSYCQRFLVQEPNKEECFWQMSSQNDRPGCKDADADLRLAIIFSHKNCNLHEKLFMLLVPPQHLNAGEVLRTTPEYSLCISAAINTLLEVKGGWY